MSDTSTKINFKCIKDLNDIVSTEHIYGYLYYWLRCLKPISRGRNQKEKNLIDTTTWKSHLKSTVPKKEL